MRQKIKQDKDFQTWVHGARRRGTASCSAARASRRTRSIEGMRIAEIAKLRGDADPADTCHRADGRRRRDDRRHVPHDVGGGRADWS